MDVNVFQSCGHGYSAYRYPNGHQALYWFSKQFKKNFATLGINQNQAKSKTDLQIAREGQSSISFLLRATERSAWPVVNEVGETQSFLTQK